MCLIARRRASVHEGGGPDQSPRRCTPEAEDQLDHPEAHYYCPHPLACDGRDADSRQVVDRNLDEACTRDDCQQHDLDTAWFSPTIIWAATCTAASRCSTLYVQPTSLR